MVEVMPAQPASDTPFAKLMARLQPICVPIVGHTPDQMQANSFAQLPDFPFQEFRLDYMADVANAIPALDEFVRQHAEATFLATCRPLPSGGCFHGSAQGELHMLKLAAAAGFPLVDLSLESAEALGVSAVQELRACGVAVLISSHDFQRAGDLHAVVNRILPLQPDMGKVVCTAETLADNLAVLELLKTVAQEVSLPLVALAMGEPGVPSRLLSLPAGGVFTFGAATESEATAPGQITARSLQDLYRLPALNANTRVYGVAGDPIHSSLSPLMLNTAFAAAKLDAIYLPLKTANAEELFRVARELPLAGFSVTMPLKQDVLPLLDEVDAIAQNMGAVNTVQCTPDGQFRGSNTDVAGIIEPLQKRIDLRGARVLVLGAGGAARAAVFGCVERGAAVSICNRTMETAQALATEAGAQAIERGQLASTRFDVLINATPAGMQGNLSELPLEEAELNAGIVFDLVYNPMETPLLTLARARGLVTIPGVEMFVHQGARQFEIWTGQRAPVEIMQEAVLNTLATRATQPRT